MKKENISVPIRSDNSDYPFQRDSDDWLENFRKLTNEEKTKIQEAW